jgi:hypothetical protein
MPGWCWGVRRAQPGEGPAGMLVVLAYQCWPTSATTAAAVLLVL